MSKNHSITYGGPGFTTFLLAILFIAFKLGGIITWSWLWVLSPLWIGLAVFLVILFFCILFILIYGFIVTVFNL